MIQTYHNKDRLQTIKIYWKNEENNIPKQEKWDINKFLYDSADGELGEIVIAAPFGIGKSSYGRRTYRF